MKRVVIATALILACVGLAKADSNTSRMGMTKPDIGSANWGPKLNTNYDIIDSSVGVLAATGTWTAGQTFSSATIQNLSVSSMTSTLPMSGRRITGLGAATTTTDAAQFQQIKISTWNTFTPGGSWSTNVTWTGRWRRVGDTMEVDAAATFSGAQQNTVISSSLPVTNTIDTTKLATSGGSNQILGHGNIIDATGPTIIAVRVLYNTTASVTLYYEGVSGANNILSPISGNTVPFTWASGDTISFRYAVPIVGWGATE